MTGMHAISGLREQLAGRGMLAIVLLMVAGCGAGSRSAPSPGPSIITTSLPDGMIGAPYSQRIEAVDGLAPYRWSVISGALPHNLAVPATGGNPTTLSGIPDRVQSSVAFTIQVMDANGRFARQSYTVTIQGTPTVAVTQSGAVRGVVEGTSLAFRGVPFAAPPVGNLRWRPPVAPPSWQGIRSAATFGNRCPQTDFAGGVLGDEECLSLNIYAVNPQPIPAQAVMVFFHGGGEVLGSAQDPPWDLVPPLAGHGVIVVTAQYRLGLLGFLAHPLLTAEAAGSSGNYGLMDMIAALRWVRDNIAQFGGDPTRVMIFGQSAGSANVEALLASPAAQGLFAAAGMESGALPSNQLGSSVTDAYPSYAKLAPLVHCDTAPDLLACLRAVPADTIVLSEQDATEFPNIFYNLEPSVLPEDPFDRLQRLGSPVPLLIGSNSEEQSASEVFSPPLGTNGYAALLRAQFDPLRVGAGGVVLSLYPATDYTNPNYAHVAVETDYHYTCETRNLARAASGPGKSRVWRYLYTHRYETDPSVTALRAFHTAELDFVSGNFQRVTYAGVPYTPSAAEITLSDQMMDYWARLARTGDPNGAGAPYWLPYDANENILQLDDGISNLAGGYRTAQCDYLSILPLRS
jgi:para-nitrobenzyl esterase